MEISESSDCVDFIWCLLRTKWLYEMEIKACVSVGVCAPVYVHMHGKAEQTISLHLHPYRFHEFECFWFQMSLPALENSKLSHFP